MPKPSRETPRWDYDCAVIGGGPGGLVSALYLRRFRRRTVLFNAGRPRASWGPKVRNLVGHDRGISGKNLLRKLHRQIAACGGVDRISELATVHRVPGGFEVRGSRGARVRARTVILATGFEDRHPKVDNLVELRERGLLKYCSICDGYEQRERPIAVLADGDLGVQKAIFLANWTKRIRILLPPAVRLAPQRIAEIRAVRAKVVRCRSLRMEPAGAAGEGLLLHVNSRRPIAVSVAYVELGCEVKDEAYRHLRTLRRTKEGFIVATSEQRTSVPGLFAVGDCVNLLGQISVAAGQAAVAATTIHNDLLG